MKKLTLILMISISVISQAQVKVFTDSIRLASISGSDTTIFITFRSEQARSIEFDFTNFNANDATLDFGYAMNRNGFASVDGFPCTIDSTTYSKTVNGVTKRLLFVRADKWSGAYIAFKVTKVSATSGTLIYRWIQ